MECHYANSPYNPDLAPCDYLANLKEILRGTRFEEDDFLVNADKEWRRRADSNFYRTGIVTQENSRGWNLSVIGGTSMIDKRGNNYYASKKHQL